MSDAPRASGPGQETQPLTPAAGTPASEKLAPETLAEVLASIRALVSAETLARVEGRPVADVIHLTPAMRVDPSGSIGAGALLAEGLEARAGSGSAAPILDEDSLRGMINAIVREELQGELGERIGRNLRKLIRREIAQMLDEAGKR